MPALSGAQRALEAFGLSVKGRLCGLKRKTSQGIALELSENHPDARNRSNFMPKSLVRHDEMLGEHLKEVLSLLSRPEAMITGGGCDIPKKGHNSAGAARQHRGRLGKTDNCQASVMVGIAGPEGRGPLDFELCVPRKWLEESECEDRRKERGVPEDLEFKTKNQLLLELIRKVSASESFQGRYAGADSAFGGDHAILDSLPEGLVCLAGVPASLLVFPARPGMVAAEWSGKGRKPAERPPFPPKTVKEVIEEPGAPWEDAGPGMGAKGPMLTKDKRVKVAEACGGKPGKDVWLCAGKLEDDSIKCALRSESMDASLEMIRKPAWRAGPPSSASKSTKTISAWTTMRPEAGQLGGGTCFSRSYASFLSPSSAAVLRPKTACRGRFPTSSPQSQRKSIARLSYRI